MREARCINTGIIIMGVRFPTKGLQPTARKSYPRQQLQEDGAGC